MKPCFLFFILVGILISTAFSQVSTQGLVAYYPFDGDGNDKSGNILIGNLINNGCTYSNTVLHSGSSSVHLTQNSTAIQYLETNSIANFDLGTAFTISLWFYYDKGDFWIKSNNENNSFDGGGIIGQGELPNGTCIGNGAKHWSLWIDKTNCNITFNYHNYGCGYSNIQYISSSNNIISPNIWYFAVVRHDGLGKLEILLNDSVIASRTDHRMSNGNFSSPLTIGALTYYYYSGTYPYGHRLQLFSGYIDDIRIYNRALGNEAIDSLYHTSDKIYPPVITSFSPKSGASGSSITIQGKNFGHNVFDNVVYFGGVRGTVSVASDSQLTVIVPIGAEYSPFIVNVNGLICQSASAFACTFASDHSINSTSFNSKVSFNAGSYTVDIASGDFDNDGKIDIVSFNQFSNTLLIHQNTSTPGSVNFASPIVIGSLSGPNNGAVADIDGDGKLDIVVCNGGANNIKVYRNIYSSGTLNSFAFSNPITLSTAKYPQDVVVDDFDGDGKQDIVVVNNQSNSISVLHNISSIGVINFEPRIDFAVGYDPNYVTTADLDSDGKPDIIVTNNLSNTISLFRNIASLGSITSNSFAPRVDIPTGLNPVGIRVMDMTGDGKPELLINMWGRDSIAVFRNTTTEGGFSSGSFADRVNQYAGGTLRSLALGDLDGDGLADIVVSNWNNYSVSVLQQKIIGNSSQPTSYFTSRKTFATGGRTYASIATDIDHDGKPDIVTADQDDGTISVLRNKIPSSSNIVVDDHVGTPEAFILYQNYPNPFNPSTKITYEVKSRSHIKIHVFNELGQIVNILRDGIVDRGFYEMEWTADKSSSGVYYYRLEAISLDDPCKQYVDTKKMVLLQ